jgi:hypothetical protein
MTMCNNYNKQLNEARYTLTTELNDYIKKLDMSTDSNIILDDIYHIKNLIEFTNEILKMQLEQETIQQNINEENDKLHDDIYKLIHNWIENHNIEDPEISIIIKEKSLLQKLNKLIEKILLLLNNTTNIMRLNSSIAIHMLAEANQHLDLFRILLNTKIYVETQLYKIQQEKIDNIHKLNMKLSSWRKQYRNINSNQRHNKLHITD